MNRKYLRALLCAFSMLVPAGAVVAQDRDIVRVGGDVVVEKGVVVKNAVAVGGSLRVDGEVTNDAVAVGGPVVLGPGAVVRRDTVSVGSTVTLGENARVYGDLVEVNAGSLRGMARGQVWRHVALAFKAVSFAGFLALALLAAAVFPRQVRALDATVEANLLRSLLWGVAGMLLLAPLAVLLVLSIVGIFLMPLVAILIIAAFVAGYIAVAQLLGRKVFLALGRAEHPLRDVLAGVILLFLISFVPFLGWLARFLVIAAGFGGVLVTLLHHRTPATGGDVPYP
jgi:hypothetical protein